MQAQQQASPEIQAFWDKGKLVESGCIEWQLSRNKDGYGSTHFNGKSYLAHRLAYTLTNGEIPAGVRILHDCDNPACINPVHLKPGTQLENMADKMQRGRDKNVQKTHCKNGHPFDSSNTYNRKAGAWGGQRGCKICRREATRNSMQRKRNGSKKETTTADNNHSGGVLCPGPG